jgi:hypothetical protein
VHGRNGGRRRPAYIRGLGAFGEGGVERVLLRTELFAIMQQVGAPRSNSSQWCGGRNSQ